jgi:hypothetical protein
MGWNALGGRARREWNPRYYRVVEEFGEATGIPVLLNTSFNLRGEPIVGSPVDVWHTFVKSGIDVLVLEGSTGWKGVRQEHDSSNTSGWKSPCWGTTKGNSHDGRKES